MKVYTNLEMESRSITDVDTLSFSNSSNNKITDTGADLKLQGNQGLELGLNTLGGIWVKNASTFRPYTGSTIELGASTSEWKNVYADKYTLNGISITSWPSGGGGWVGSATSTLDMNGYAIIDTTSVTGRTDLGLYAPDDVFIEAQGDDLYLRASDDIWIQWNRGGTEYSMRCNSYRFAPFSHSCFIDLGTSSLEFDRGYFNKVLASVSSSTCDLAELQFTAEDVEPGDIVELTDWEGWEKKHFDAEVEECKKNQCSTIKFFGYQGRWIKAKKRSTKCPSVISIQPALSMGSTAMREELYRQGKMNHVALSGSIPFVFIEGDFKSGDIIVSAGNGKGMSDNKANWNEVVGYAKRSGKDERCEIWVR